MFPHSWCLWRSVDPISASPQLVLEFLQDGLDKKLKPATLRRQLAALDSVLRGNDTLGRHPLIQRFLKGATLMDQPPQVHRFLTWNLGVVLQALMRDLFKPLQRVDLKWVRLKVIFLVTITSARWISELGASPVSRLFVPSIVTKWCRGWILPSYQRYLRDSTGNRRSHYPRSAHVRTTD